MSLDKIPKPPSSIGGVMGTFSVRALSMTYCKVEPRAVKPKPKQLVFAASPLGTQYNGVRSKTAWHGISTVITCVPVGCCFSELAL